MKSCSKCGIEIDTKDGENECDDCDIVSDTPIVDAIQQAKHKRANEQRRARHAAMTDLGLVRVRGVMGGVYYE